MHAKPLKSCLTLCDPMAIVRQAPLSMGFSRQESWSGLPCPPPEDLPDPGMGRTPHHVSCIAGGVFTSSAIREARESHHCVHISGELWVCHPSPLSPYLKKSKQGFLIDRTPPNNIVISSL